MRPHPIVWLDRTMSVWWPFFVSLAAICLIATMSYVTWTVVDERKYFEEEQARDERQDEALAELLEVQRIDDTESARKIADALDDAERLLAERFAQHDLNVAQKLNEMLRRIEVLLGRPAGIPVDPVTAEGLGVQPSTSRSAVDAPAPSSSSERPASRPAPSPAPAGQAPTTTTTTTTQPESPGQSGLCDRLSRSPICRSNR